MCKCIFIKSRSFQKDANPVFERAIINQRIMMIGRIIMIIIGRIIVVIIGRIIMTRKAIGPTTSAPAR
jgi:hypothetical protein